MESPSEKARRLNLPTNQESILLSLLRDASRGLDISEAAGSVARYTLRKDSASVLSLAIDALRASPTHAEWRLVADVIQDVLADETTGEDVVHVVLSKVGRLPFVVAKVLVAATAQDIARWGQSAKLEAVRVAAVEAAAALCLRERPLTEVPDLSSPTSVTLLVPEAETAAALPKLIRRGLEGLIEFLLRTMVDSTPLVASRAFSLVADFSSGADPPKGFPNLYAKESLAKVLNARLTASVLRIHRNLEALTEEQQNEASQSFAKTAALILGSSTERIDNDDAAKAQQWALTWVDNSLLSQATNGSPKLKTSSSRRLLFVASHVNAQLHSESRMRWGVAALGAMLKALHENVDAASMTGAAIVLEFCVGLEKVCSWGSIPSKFLLSCCSELVEHCTRLERQKDRLYGFSLVSRLVLTHDLAAGTAGIAGATTALLSSSSVSTIMDAGKMDPGVPSEWVCCVSHACLHAGERIADERDIRIRNSLGDVWGYALGKVVLRLAPALSWAQQTSSIFAGQMLLKLFEALGHLNAVLLREKGQSLEDYERAQEILVRQSLSQENPVLRSALITTVTHFWLESGLKAEANAGHTIRAIWEHLQGSYQDEVRAKKQTASGELWSQDFFTSMSKSTFPVDTVAVGVSSAVELARRIPRSSEKIRSMLVKYMKRILQSPMCTAQEEDIVHSAMKAVEMFFDQHFPKYVPPRTLAGMNPVSPFQDHLAWLRFAKESCIFATSRIENPNDEKEALKMEESILRRSESVRDSALARKADHQVLSGSSDPFSIIASHALLSESSSILLQVRVTNRSRFDARNGHLQFQCSDGIFPLPGSRLRRPFSSIPSGESLSFGQSFLVRASRSGVGRVLITITLPRGESVVELHALPFVIPSSDILLLEPPPRSSGMNVFRRRWDLAKYRSKLLVQLQEDQSLDLLVDVLERKSQLRQVGRMRAHVRDTVLARFSHARTLANR